MKKGVITNAATAIEFQEAMKKLSDYGVALENIIIKNDFDSALSQINNGDTIIVLSYSDVFSSLTELFSKATVLYSRNITIESIAEPMVNISSNNIDFISQLSDLNCKICASRTKKGLKKAVEKGKKLGRPFGTIKVDEKVLAAIKLRKNSNITVEKACKIAGCKTRAFYRYQEKYNENV